MPSPAPTPDNVITIIVYSAMEESEFEPIVYMKGRKTDRVADLNSQIRIIVADSLGVAKENQVLLINTGHTKHIVKENGYDVICHETELPNTEATLEECGIVSGTTVWVQERA